MLIQDALIVALKTASLPLPSRSDHCGRALKLYLQPSNGSGQKSIKTRIQGCDNADDGHCYGAVLCLAQSILLKDALELDEASHNTLVLISKTRAEGAERAHESRFEDACAGNNVHVGAILSNSDE